MNNPPLPALQQQTLDDDTLDCLVRDLGQCASILDVRGKTAARGHAADEVLTLADAVISLRQGRLRGVQIRYCFDGGEWLDTLVTTPAGIHLTRISVRDAGLSNSQDGGARVEMAN
jgi:hypothetical protein